MSAIAVTVRDGGVRVPVRVQPKASSDALAGSYGESLKIRLMAPPVDGAANDALVTFLARQLGVARAAVRIVSGAGSRSKVVEIDGVTSADIHRLVEGPEAEGQ